MISQLNHIGIAVKSLDEHIPFYRDILKLPCKGGEIVADQKVKTAMFQVGEVKIELLQPTEADSPIAKFIEKKGEGIHHVAYQSDEVTDEIKRLKDEGIQLIDETPRQGAHNCDIAFLHPKSTGKVLTEICTQR